jgi:hypothetical protein
MNVNPSSDRSRSSDPYINHRQQYRDAAERRMAAAMPQLPRAAAAVPLAAPGIAPPRITEAFNSAAAAATPCDDDFAFEMQLAELARQSQEEDDAALAHQIDYDIKLAMRYHDLPRPLRSYNHNVELMHPRLSRASGRMVEDSLLSDAERADSHPCQIFRHLIACWSQDPKPLSQLVLSLDDRWLECPITCCRLQDPLLAPDGNSYERQAILDSLTSNPRSPLTREPMHPNMLIAHEPLRQLIAENFAPEQN